MSAKVSEKLWRLGAKNAFLVGLIMLAVCLILAGVVSLFTPWSWSNSLGLAFFLLFTVAISITFANSARDRVRAGSLLLDAGAHPTRSLFLITSLLFFVIGINDTINFASSYSSEGFFTQFSVFMPYVLLTCAVFYLYMSFGRLQIRENGIWVYWGLHPWEKIASYTWTEDANLLVRTNGWFGFWRGGMAVPPEHQAAFERYLLERTGQ